MRISLSHCHEGLPSETFNVDLPDDCDFERFASAMERLIAAFWGSDVTIELKHGKWGPQGV